MEDIQFGTSSPLYVCVCVYIYIYIYILGTRDILMINSCTKKTRNEVFNYKKRNNLEKKKSPTRMDFATKNVKCKDCEVTQGMWDMTTQQRGSTHMQTKSEYQIISETFFFL